MPETAATIAVAFVCNSSVCNSCSPMASRYHDAAAATSLATLGSRRRLAQPLSHRQCGGLQGTLRTLELLANFLHSLLPQAKTFTRAASRELVRFGRGSSCSLLGVSPALRCGTHCQAPASGITSLPHIAAAAGATNIGRREGARQLSKSMTCLRAFPFRSSWNNPAVSGFFDNVCRRDLP